MNEHEKWMARACMLAKRGIGRVDPNPLVGAVIVKDGQIVAEGWHEQYGQLHAERNALKQAEEKGILGDVEGGIIYVTLEPCCHYGKTPPCTEAIIKHKLKAVVIGCLDPNPLVAGKGVQQLKNHGINVIVGVLENQCRKINKKFFQYISTGMPFTTMKYAMTADGKIATYKGDSKWVTGVQTRAHVHFLRHQYQGIMVGINTVLNDDPMLNCRIQLEQLSELLMEEDRELAHYLMEDLKQKGPSHPLRIVCDSRLRIPLQSQLVQTASEIPLIVGCCEDVMSQSEKILRLESAGAKILPVKSDRHGHLSLRHFMEQLGRMKISSILLEGGAELNYSALEDGLVDKVMCYIAPKLIGGTSARTPIGGQGIPKMSEAVMLEDISIRRFDQAGDILLEYSIKNTSVSKKSEDINREEADETCLLESLRKSAL